VKGLPTYPPRPEVSSLFRPVNVFPTRVSCVPVDPPIPSTIRASRGSRDCRHLNGRPVLGLADMRRRRMATTMVVIDSATRMRAPCHQTSPSRPKRNASDVPATSVAQARTAEVALPADG
jgi:hypothetical protein